MLVGEARGMGKAGKRRLKRERGRGAPAAGAGGASQAGRRGSSESSGSPESSKASQNDRASGSSGSCEGSRASENSRASQSNRASGGSGSSEGGVPAEKGLAATVIGEAVRAVRDGDHDAYSGCLRQLADERTRDRGKDGIHGLILGWRRSRVGAQG